jgi:hypothetical protein
MSGVVVVLGHCIACGTLFSFNAERVPSVRMFFEGGEWHPDPARRRHPLCSSCWSRFNDRRESEGLERLPTLPGAYDPEELDAEPP